MVARFSSIAALAQKLFLLKKTQKNNILKKISDGRKSATSGATMLKLGLSLLHPRSSPWSAQVLSSLGDGNFGHVFKVRLLQPDDDDASRLPLTLEKSKKSESGGDVVALKIFKNKHHRSGDDSIANEIWMSLWLSGMATGKTPIVRALNAHTTEDGAHLQELGMASDNPKPRLHLLDMYSNRNNVSTKKVEPRTLQCMTMELCQGGDLLSLLQEIKNRGSRKVGLMTETEAVSFLYPLAKGIQFCHMNNVLHLDVKPQNVLFRKKGRLETACLIDFSLAIVIPRDKPTLAIDSLSDAIRSTPGTGTDRFMAPEVATSGYYSPLADVFSLGCVLLLALTGISFSWNGFHGWLHHDHRYVADLISGAHGNRKAWESLSDNMKRLITGMLCPNPLRRLNLDQVLYDLHRLLYDPWIADKLRGDWNSRRRYVYEAWVGVKQAMAHFLGWELESELDVSSLFN